MRVARLATLAWLFSQVGQETISMFMVSPNRLGVNIPVRLLLQVRNRVSIGVIAIFCQLLSFTQ